MIESDNKYTNLQKNNYDKGTSDHLEHNDNEDYWHILLKPVYNIDNTTKNALDFGCGQGRNIQNLSVFGFNRIDGVDLSKNNVEHCRKRFPNSKLFENNGVDLKDIQDNEYDFVMSTIVLQHIPVYDIRFNLLQEIFRVMKPGGVFSLQMGFGYLNKGHTHYFDNNYDVGATNGAADVQVVIPQDLMSDFTKIGFQFNKMVISKSYLDSSHEYWIYSLVTKPEVIK